MFDYTIVSLPRSRTTWLANLLTSGEDLCYHDFYSYIDKYTSKRYIRHQELDSVSNKLGNCSPNPYTTLEGSVLIIERDIEEIYTSTAKYIQNTSQSFLEAYRAGLEVAKRHLDSLDGYRINFHDINDKVYSILDYLKIDNYCADRVEMLKDMNVQSTDNVLGEK